MLKYVYFKRILGQFFSIDKKVLNIGRSIVCKKYQNKIIDLNFIHENDYYWRDYKRFMITWYNDDYYKISAYSNKLYYEKRYYTTYEIDISSSYKIIEVEIESEKTRYSRYCSTEEYDNIMELVSIDIPEILQDYTILFKINYHNLRKLYKTIIRKFVKFYPQKLSFHEINLVEVIENLPK